MSENAPARLSTKYGFDVFDGRQVPKLVVTDDYLLSGVHQGGIHVEAGCFRLVGTQQGSLDVMKGATASIFGLQQGSISVATDAVVTVAGAIQGSAYVAAGGLLIIEAGGRLAGSLKNYGNVLIRGVFGGPATGDGHLRLEDGGHIKEPVQRDGVSYYEW
jgi:hypothetical protein